MTATEMTRYRTLLKAKECELVEALRNREAITIQRTADTIDEVLLAGERELAVRNLDREGQVLRTVRSALARFADGSYGVCLRCEEAISPKRLNAVPWAAHCVTCQDAIDRNSPELTASLKPAFRAEAA